ncbi:MAG TPA: amidohydrolase family protein [Spirochaetota bacterium]|nr:amidohydrolase family protein [Spirochaetota bacterium]HOD16641.1 amidohydrolase family protein [Spirochaetota bacterium]HPG50270.1 amidohydrolase family protein [Spirochaetota bacterium]HPN12291.1 amidohydrolase family protein [Spirochaetota bacterium]
MIDKKHGFNRRDFLKYSAATLATALLPDFMKETPAHAAALPEVDYGMPLRIANCSVVDVSRGATVPGRTITMDRGVITAIEPYRPEHDAMTGSIDANGCHVIPGLIDGHCHLTLQSCADFRIGDLSRQISQIKNNGLMQINAGVTTVRDMGSFPRMMRDLLKDYELGGLTGPRVIYCNGIMNINGGHPDVKPSEISIFGPLSEGITGRMNLAFTSRKELLRLLAENLESGASFIKLTMDDRSLICGRGKIPVYADEDLAAVFDFADKKGVPVAMHSLMQFGLKRALKYPVHSMEHCTGDALLSDEDINTMAAKKITIVPTLQIGHNFAFSERYDTLPERYRTPFIENELRIKYDYFNAASLGGFDPYLHALNMASIGWFRDPGCAGMPKQKKFMTDPEVGFEYLLHAPQNARRMKDAGILMGCGTDSGVPFHYHGSLWREMAFMSRIGFRHEDILRFATVNNASIIGAGDSIGEVREGKNADLVVLGENPLQKIEAVRAPLLVMLGGRVKAGPGLRKDDRPGRANCFTIRRY